MDVEWKFRDDDQTYFFPSFYRGRYVLEARWLPAEQRWRCIARSDNYDDGYREANVAGDAGDPSAAMQRCFELADAWAGAH